jgi:hypothetical protein
MKASIRMGLASIAVGALPLAAAAVPDGNDCGGFTAAEAAAFLKAPAARVTREVTRAGDKWVCTFAVGKTPAIEYSLSVAATPKRAADDLERYRDRLHEEAASTRWKNRLPNGVYADLFGLGDEAVWTDINNTFTVRRDNVTVRFNLPRGKDEQVSLAKVVVEGF